MLHRHHRHGGSSISIFNLTKPGTNSSEEVFVVVIAAAAWWCILYHHSSLLQFISDDELGLGIHVTKRLLLLGDFAIESWEIKTDLTNETIN